MQLKYKTLFNLARRISAINATMRRSSKPGKRRDHRPQALADILGQDVDYDPSSILTADIVSVAPLNINLADSSVSSDTLYNSAPSIEVVVSDSESDYYMDSASIAPSTLLDNQSYSTAQEVLSFKTFVMDPLNAQTPEAESPATEEQVSSNAPVLSSLDEPLTTETDSVTSTSIGREPTGLYSETLDNSSPDMPSEYEPKDDALLASPPPMLVEPEVPDPFIIEEEEDDDEDDQSGGDERLAKSITPSVAADDEIALAQSILEEPSPSTPTQPQTPHAPASITSPYPQAALFSPTPNVNKDIPAPPSAPSSEEEEEELPELYLPGLIMPTMFLPIPNTDPLTTLLTKYIPLEKRPSRDLSGEWQRNDFHTLVMTNSWRALARMARDRIVSGNPEDIPLILSLWYLRLASLARMRLFNQTSAECTNLFTVLNAIEPASARTYLFERILPFELEVLQAKTQYWSGDHMSYLDALSALLTRCKTQARMASRKKDQAGLAMWRERGARVCLILASQLIEMKDFTAAARLLEPLCLQDGTSSPHLRSAVARIYLQGGYVARAIKHFTAIEQDTTADSSLKAMNAALLASAEGDWEGAETALREIIQEDPENYVAVNNLAVTLLSRGHLKEGIDILEDAIKTSPSTIVVVEPFLFNLSTLYELRSRTAADKKRELLVEVAKWAGDGLRIACLKMPST